MADAKIQWRAWQSGEQEKQGGGGLGQVIEARTGQDRVGHCIGYDGDQGASQAMMDGSTEGWVRGRARVRAWG